MLLLPAMTTTCCAHGSREALRSAILIAASLCAVALAPRAAGAQTAVFLRLAPETGVMTVEHTKRVTVQGGSSESASSSSGPLLAANVSAGVRRKFAGNWLAGGEIEGVFSGRIELAGPIVPTPNGNVHDVWPGEWDFRDQYGVGGNVIVGREVGSAGTQVYVFGGVRRMWTEFASGRTNPATGARGETRDRVWRSPWTIGVGTTLDLAWPLDIRVRYFRSRIDRMRVAEGTRIDYEYAASGVAVSAGISLSR